MEGWKSEKISQMKIISLTPPLSGCMYVIYTNISAEATLTVHFTAWKWIFHWEIFCGQIPGTCQIWAKSNNVDT